jgi:DNA polymerase I
MPSEPMGEAGKSASEPLGKAGKPLLLVDASYFLFRAYFALPAEFVDRDGNPAHAVHGFVRFALDLIEQERPTHVAFAFDASLGTSWRHALYPAYKANREPAPDELKLQFISAQSWLSALGFARFDSSELEADDLLAALTRQARAAGQPICLVTADKDLAQLIRPGDQFYEHSKGKRWQHAECIQRFDVHPEQMVDFLALTGDAVDNIPGVTGVGKKSAAELLRIFGSGDALFERLGELPFMTHIRGAGALTSKLRAGREAFALSRQLVQLRDQPDLVADLAELRQQPADLAMLHELSAHLQLGPRSLRRSLALALEAGA